MAETETKLYSFPCFGLLTEDLQVSILTYIAAAPFEKSTATRTGEDIFQECRSPLTHVLPLVSKQFHQYCQLDLFWKTAIHRLLQKDYDLWKTGLLHVLSVPNEAAIVAAARHNEGENTASGVVEEPNDPSTLDSPTALWSFLERIHDRWGESVVYRILFRDVVSRYLRSTAPIFYMQGHVKLQEVFRLHFFEQRYRFMISELLLAYPEASPRGTPIAEGHRPTFLYVFDGHPPPAAGKPACLVQVTRCYIFPNGTADVECLPVDYVYLENVWVRQERGHLFMGQSRRMGQAWKDNNVRPQQDFPPPLGLWLERILRRPDAVVIRQEGNEDETNRREDHPLTSAHLPNDRRF